MLSYQVLGHSECHPIVDHVRLKLQYLKPSCDMTIMIPNLNLKGCRLSEQLQVIFLEVQGHLETLGGFGEVLLLLHDGPVGMPAEHARHFAFL